MEYQKKISNKQLNQSGVLDLGGVQQPDTDYDNFYSGVMNARDVIQNIIRNLSDVNVSGIAFKFHEDKLILSVNVYEFPSDQILKDMIDTANEAIKYLKTKFKDATGKTLKMKKISDTYDTVGAYTSNQKAKITYNLVFDIGKNDLDPKVNTLDKENVYDEKRKPDFRVA